MMIEQDDKKISSTTSSSISSYEKMMKEKKEKKEERGAKEGMRNFTARKKMWRCVRKERAVLCLTCHIGCFCGYMGYM